jgi:hypothetical protein
MSSVLYLYTAPDAAGGQAALPLAGSVPISKRCTVSAQLGLSCPLDDTSQQRRSRGDGEDARDAMARDWKASSTPGLDARNECPGNPVDQ